MSNKVWVCDDEGSPRFPVFARGNVGEVFVEAVSALTWSAYGPHAWDAGRIESRSRGTSRASDLSAMHEKRPGPRTTTATS